MTAATITERVAAGAAFFDQREPGWPDRINLGRLDINDPDCCMTGQLQPATSEAWTWARVCRAAGWEMPADGSDDVSLGFDVADESTPAAAAAEFDALTAEWRRVIEARRAGASGGAL